MRLNSARKEPISHLSKPGALSFPIQSSQVPSSHFPEDRENLPQWNEPRVKAVETEKTTYQTAVLSNAKQIESLNAEIAKKQAEFEKATLEAADKAGLEEEIRQKSLEIVLSRDKVSNLKKENMDLSKNIKELDTKSTALRVGREAINKEKSDLEATIASLLAAQTLAETRLHELQAMNRNYEDTLDVSIGKVARMYASVKREEDLCFELIAQLERKKGKASDLQAEWKQVDSELQEIEERDWDEEHKREIEAVDGSCEEIWEALEKTKKQIAEAQANLSAREAKAQEQSEEAEALKSKLAQYPAKSALSGVLSQALFALLLGLVLSLLLPRVSHSFEISSF